MGERPHVLLVRQVGDPDGREFADWEIVHLDECPTEVLGEDDAGVPFVAYRCAVGAQEAELAVRWNLRYSGTPVETPGRYLIEFWAHGPHDGSSREHDVGLAVVHPDPEAACPVCDGNRVVNGRTLRTDYGTGSEGDADPCPWCTCERCGDTGIEWQDYWSSDTQECQLCNRSWDPVPPGRGRLDG